MRSLPLLLLLCLVGCGDEFSNAVFETDQRFLDAVPRARDLRLSGPTTDGVVQQALVGERAELYTLTRVTTLQIDRAVFHQLRDVERLVAEPPGERGDDRRVWGPFRHPLDDFESRFVMNREDDGFEYAYEARRDGDAEFTTVIDGRYDDGVGALTFHSGEAPVTVAYTLEDDGAVDITMEAGDGNFAYRREPDGSGEFEMAVRGADDATFELRTRWIPGGEGRADAKGDDHVVSECWDDAFGRTWYDAGVAAEGDSSACPFSDVALPERVSLP